MAIERAGSEDPSVRYVEYVRMFAKVAKLAVPGGARCIQRRGPRSPNGGRPWGRRFEVTLCNVARQLTTERYGASTALRGLISSPLATASADNLRGLISSSLMSSALGANFRSTRDTDPVRRPMP